MDYKQKMQQLVSQFNNNQQLIDRLAADNNKILGQLDLIKELEKEMTMPPVVEEAIVEEPK